MDVRAVVESFLQNGSGADPLALKAANTQLAQLKEPANATTAFNTLLEFLCNQSLPLHVRQLAGTAIRQIGKHIDPAGISASEAKVAALLAEDSVEMRNYASTLLSMMIARHPPHLWGSLLQNLLQLASGGPMATLGVSRCFCTIAEDHREFIVYDMDEAFQSAFLNGLMDMATKGDHTNAQSLGAKAHAINAIASVLRVYTGGEDEEMVFGGEADDDAPPRVPVNKAYKASIKAFTRQVVPAVYAIATDPHQQGEEFWSAVMDLSCAALFAFEGILQVVPDLAHGAVLGMQCATHETVQRKSVELLTDLAQLEGGGTALVAHLNAILPALLECLKQTDENLSDFHMGEDWNQPDETEKVKPQLHLRKNANAAEAGEDASAGAEDEHDEVSSGTLREAATWALNTFSVQIGAPFFEAVLPMLAGTVSSPDWRVQEAAITGLGELCDEGFSYLVDRGVTSILQTILSTFQSANPVVRCAGITALENFALGICSELEDGGFASDEEEGEAAETATPSFSMHDVTDALRRLLDMCADRNKACQYKALNSVRVVAKAMCAQGESEDGEGDGPQPAVLPDDVMRNICGLVARCTDFFQLASRMEVFHVIGSVAQADKSKWIAQNHAVLVPQMIARWAVVPPSGCECGAIAHALVMVIESMGPDSGTYGNEVCTRCVDILKHFMASPTSGNTNEAIVDDDSASWALDIISTFAAAVKSEIVVFFDQTNIMAALLPLAAYSESPELQRSAAGVIGEYAHVARSPDSLAPYAAKVFALVVENLRAFDEATIAVHSNYCWCGAQWVNQIGASVADLLPGGLEPFIAMLVFFLNQTDVGTLTFRQNVALLASTLALRFPNQFGPHTESFTKSMAFHVPTIDDADERSVCVMAMGVLVQSLPNNFANLLRNLVQVVASHPSPSADVVALWTPILGQIGKMADLRAMKKTLTSSQRRNLNKGYGI